MKKSELRRLIREQIENEFLNTIYMTQLDSVINGLEGGNTDKEYIRKLKRTSEKIKKDKEEREIKRKEKEAQLEPMRTISTIPYVPGINQPPSKKTPVSQMKADMAKRKEKLKRKPIRKRR